MACSCLQECSNPEVNCLKNQDTAKGVSGVRIEGTLAVVLELARQGWTIQQHLCCSVWKCSCGSKVLKHWHCLAPGQPEPPWWDTWPPFDEPKEDPPPTPYTIEIPGLTDIIKIPSLESEQLRRQQMARWKQSNSPIPEPLKWIPSVINFLDDCQDLLITVLLASRWFLKRLPARLVPGLGWILTINDLANLITTLLAITMGGRTLKRATLQTTFWMFTRRAFRVQSVGQFLSKKFPWTSFILQGGQVARDWTGYGIQLGTVMGFISGSFWGTFQAAQGNEVVVKGPLAADPLGKAARVLGQAPQHVYMRDILTPEEHKMIITACFVAIHLLRETDTPEIYSSRAASAGEMAYPLYEPWAPGSLRAMKEEGIVFDPNPETGTRNYLPTQFAYPQVADVLRPLTTELPRWEDAMSNVLGSDKVGGTLMGYLHNLTWIDHINWANSDALIPPPPPQDPKRRPRLFDYEDSILPVPEDWEIDASHAIEYSVYPVQPINQDQLLAWLSRARALSLQKGLRHASFEDLKIAAIEVLGGFVRRPFQTYTGL